MVIMLLCRIIIVLLFSLSVCSLASCKTNENKQLKINNEFKFSPTSMAKVRFLANAHLASSAKKQLEDISCDPNSGNHNSPKGRFNVEADTYLVSGTGEVGAVISIYSKKKSTVGLGDKICDTKVDSDSNWTCGQVNKPKNDGEYTLTAQQILESIESIPSSTDSVDFNVKSDDNDVDNGGTGGNGNGGGTGTCTGGGENSTPNSPYMNFPAGQNDGGAVAAAAAAAAGAAGAAAGIFNQFAGSFGNSMKTKLIGGSMHLGFVCGNNKKNHPVVLNLSKANWLGFHHLSWAFPFSEALKQLPSGFKFLKGQKCKIDVAAFDKNNNQVGKVKHISIPIPVESSSPSVPDKLVVLTPQEGQIIPYGESYAISGWASIGTKITVVNKVTGTIICSIEAKAPVGEWVCTNLPATFIHSNVGKVTLNISDESNNSVDLHYTLAITKLNIINPYASQLITGGMFSVAGTGESGLKVKVTGLPNFQTCQAKINESGVWNCPAYSSIPGNYTINAATYLDSINLGDNESLAFSIASGVINVLTVESPANGARITASRYMITGVAKPNQNIAITGLPDAKVCYTYSDSESGSWSCGLYRATKHERVTIVVSQGLAGTSDYESIVHSYFLAPSFTVESPMENAVLTPDNNYYVSGNAPIGDSVLIQGNGYTDKQVISDSKGNWLAGPYIAESGYHRIKVTDILNSETPRLYPSIVRSFLVKSIESLATISAPQESADYLYPYYLKITGTGTPGFYITYKIAVGSQANGVCGKYGYCIGGTVVLEDGSWSINESTLLKPDFYTLFLLQSINKGDNPVGNKIVRQFKVFIPPKICSKPPCI